MNIRQIIKVCAVSAAILCVAVICDLLISSYGLSVSKFDVEASKTEQSIKIVQLSDLHSKSFGKDNSRLIKEIKKIKPDITLLTGDMINSTDEDITVVTDLIRELSDIAPVYCSIGNHEIDYEKRAGIDIREKLTSAGSVVLDKNYTDIEVNGQSVRIGGIYGYCLPERYNSNNADEISFLRSFENTDSYKILLSHLPYAWVNYGFCEDYDIDMIFAGHTHGGMIRLPFIGGLFEPEIGYFPGKCAGLYEDDNTYVLLSRGLGTSSSKIKRFNNIPEIIEVDITANKK